MRKALAELDAMLDSVMRADARRLRARLKRLDREPHGDNAAEDLRGAIESSARLRERREALVPKVDYPPELPVSQRAGEIAQAVRDAQVVVVCGDTGSGKTTQLPKVLLEMGLGVSGAIGHTQPRRLAARSVAARIASELGVTLGQQIGSKVRFGDKTSDATLVKLMTDGILLAEIQSDPHLLAYDAIIIDEAHERSLNIDFLLGYLRRLLPKRPDLKIVITSATIDPERFAAHFADARGEPAPIVMVEGRTYPVELRYEPPAEDTERYDAVADAIDRLWSEQRGDVLVFEPGEREIRDTARTLERRFGDSAEILPLFARLAHHHQDEIFRPGGRRRVVVATNVAETSLTVPGIRYVVDTGRARINRYSPRTKVQRLEIEPISRASARQRAGRCGRVQHGVCVRLYSEEDHDQRDEFTDPEILRSSLAAVILQMRAQRLGAVEDFPFIDPPESRRIADGYELLTQLGALDAEHHLTRIGRTLSRLPLDPRLGRVLIEASENKVLHEAMVIVSALSVEDPRERPFEQREAADEAHAQFAHADSDFMVLLRIWRWFEEASDEYGSSRLKKECVKRFLSFRKLHEWRATHRQIRLMLAASGYRATVASLKDEQLYEPLHRALLCGLLDGVGKKLDKKDPKTRQWEYEDQRGQRFSIFPGSALAKTKPRWLVATELVRTTRLFARLCARVQPDWIEHAAGTFIKREYTDVHWHAGRGKVMARERVGLGALELISDRQVHLGPIDPALARSVFIEQGVLTGDLRARPRWLKQCYRVMDEARASEHKLRVRGTLGIEDAALDWLHGQIPESVFSEGRLERWLKRARPRRLTMEDLVPGGRGPDTSAFPDEDDRFGTPLKLRYLHEPGTQDDGVSVDVTLEDLPALDPERCVWLVPGRLGDVVEALLRQLPKAVRRQIDVPRAVEACRGLRPEGSLPKAIAERVGRETGVAIDPRHMDPSALGDELRLRVRVVDERGEEIDQGRDIEALQRTLAPSVQTAQKALSAEGYPQRGFTAWSFDDPPSSVPIGKGARRRDAFPAIVDTGVGVDIELRTSEADAKAETRAGVRRLAAIALKRELKIDPRRLPGFERAAAAYATLGEIGQLKDEVVLAAADRAFGLGEGDAPTTGRAFDERAERAWEVGLREAQGVVEHAGRLLALRHRLVLSLTERAPEAWEHSIADMHRHLDRLIGPRFLTSTPEKWRPHLERFSTSIERRIAKLRSGSLARDTQCMLQVHAIERRITELAQRGRAPAEVERLAWLTNELRVSLFAQELRTSLPISVQKMEAWIDEAWKV